MKKLFLLCLFGFPLGLLAQPNFAREAERNMRAMETALESGNWQAVAQMYRDDAVLVGANHEVKGRENINAYWQALAGRVSDWQLETVEIIPAGNNTFIQRGISRLHYKDSSRVDVVRYTTVWVKQGRAWKMRVDHYTAME